MKYEQHPPFAIQVELTEGCNLYCDFCGLRGIRGGPGQNFKFMTIKIAENAARQIAEAGWRSRIELAMHGEPTMNPSMLDIVSTFRKHLPKNHIMMTSNGGGLLKDATTRIPNLFKAGLNVLALDNYEGVKIVDKIVDALRRDNVEGFEMYDYPSCGPVGNPHIRRPLSSRVLIVVQDIRTASKGTHAKLNNHCGAAAPPNNEQVGKRCAKPFRELSIRYDGRIAGCCNDWRGVLKVGNINETNIEELWLGDVMYAMRRKLFHGMRDFGACKGCDHITFRNGLLPDNSGRAKLPKPSAKDLEVLDKACKGKSYAVPVWRDWERKK